MVTPQQEYPDLGRAVGVPSLYLKREDLHPYGSHKGRSIPVMIDAYVQKGSRHFAISSSGNAALAAALHIQELNKGTTEKTRLEILVGEHIPEKKLRKLLDLADPNISVMRFERPLMTLTQKTADGRVTSLRQSTDDTALEGYRPLAEELDKIQGLNAIFMAASSGTTAQALAGYFLKKKEPVEIHIVQTTSCHPLSVEFVDSVPSEEISTADAISDITALRKKNLVPLIEKTGGSGWIATNEEIRTAQELVKNHAGIDMSANGALPLAGLMQAAFTGREWDGPVVCVIGGE